MERYIFLLLSSLAMLSSCQEEVRLELRNQETIPVIEAIWTDRATLNKVHVTYTRDFYDTLDNRIEEEARVSIIDLENGNQIPFRFVERLGYYLPVNNVEAVVGKSYRLEVWIGEEYYYSEGRVLDPPTLDSLVYSYEPGRVFREEGFYVRLYGQIPFTDNNNFRGKVVRNDTLLNRRGDYLLFDDTFGGGILENGFELSGFRFEENDRVRVEIYRMERPPYDYLTQLVNLLFNDGGLFSPPPENPSTNIKTDLGRGKVAGFFMPASVVSATVLILGEDDP
jgi:hypothetical protein